MRNAVETLTVECPAFGVRCMVPEVGLDAAASASQRLSFRQNGLTSTGLRKRRLLACGVLGSAGASLLLLALYPNTPLLPPCPIHQLFGIQCPGCGATRSLIAILHGNFMSAIQANALFVASLPFVLLYATRTLRRAFRSTTFNWPSISPAALTLGTTCALLFTLYRNW